MSSQDDYEKKLETLKAIEDDRIKTPHHVPVEAYIQEAQSLYRRAMKDKDALTAAGLSWELVEDLPVRIGALVEAESSWYVQRNTRKEAAAVWTEQSQLAYQLRRLAPVPFPFSLKDEDCCVRYIAARALGKIRSENAVEPLIQTLLDNDENSCVQTLLDNDENSRIRRAAANALGEIKSVKAVEALRKVFLNDEHSDVRKAAFWALKEIRK